jgi:hypothetical protein
MDIVIHFRYQVRRMLSNDGTLSTLDLGGIQSITRAMAEAENQRMPGGDRRRPPVQWTAV